MDARHCKVRLMKSGAKNQPGPIMPAFPFLKNFLTQHHLTGHLHDQSELNQLDSSKFLYYTHDTCGCFKKWNQKFECSECLTCVSLAPDAVDCRKVNSRAGTPTFLAGYTYTWVITVGSFAFFMRAKFELSNYISGGS